MKILNGFVICFGIWTLVSNLMNILHQSLFMTVALTVLICGLVFVYWFTQKPIAVNELVENSQKNSFFNSISLGRLRRYHLIILALIICIILFFTKSLVVFWMGSLLLLPSVILFEFFNKDEQAPPIDQNNLLSSFSQKRDWLVLVLLCSIAVFTILIVQSNDSDDSFYFNRSAVLTKAPFEPLPDYWTLFPPEMSAGFPYPTWPLIAYHDFVGALAWLLNMEVFPVIAYIVAPSLAIMMVLSYTALFKAIAPHSWIWLSLIIVSILISGGTSKHFVGTLSIPRLWQGKSIFLHVMIPLTYLYGIRFGATGRWRDFVFLALAQVSMFGFTTMAVWLSPIVAGIAVLTSVIIYQPSQTLQRLIYTVGSSFYPLLIGIISYTTLQKASENINPPIENMVPVLQESFGNVNSQLFWMIVVLMSVVLIPHKIIRVLIAVSALFLSTIFANPLLATYISKYITSEPIYWRIFWMLPILIALAGLITLPIEYSYKWKFSTKKRVVAFVLALCLVLGYNGSLNTYRTLPLIPSQSSFYKMDLLQLKIPSGPYNIANLLVENLPEGSLIAADWDTSWVVPMFRKQIYPIMPKRNAVYNVFVLQNDNPEEYEFRYYLLQYATGVEPYDEAQWLKAVQSWSLDAIVVRENVDDIDSFRSFLSSQGYTEQSVKKYIIFGKGLADLE